MKGLVPSKSLRDDFFGPLEQTFDEFFSGFWNPSTLSKLKANSYPKMDVAESKDEFVVTVSVPGVDESDLKIEILKEAPQIKSDLKMTRYPTLLRISGKMSNDYEMVDEQRFYVKELCKRSFIREVNLPDHIKDDEPGATLKNGILVLRWKLTLEEVKPKNEVKLISITKE